MPDDILAGVTGTDRRGSPRPVASRRVTPATAKRKQAEARKRRFDGPAAIPQPADQHADPAQRLAAMRKPAKVVRVKGRAGTKPAQAVGSTPAAGGQQPVAKIRPKRKVDPVVGMWWLRNGEDVVPVQPPETKRGQGAHAASELVVRSESPGFRS